MFDDVNDSKSQKSIKKEILKYELISNNISGGLKNKEFISKMFCERAWSLI